MELQAVRYASMVSAMTFARAEEIHAEFLMRVESRLKKLADPDADFSRLRSR